MFRTKVFTEEEMVSLEKVHSADILLVKTDKKYWRGGNLYEVKKDPTGKFEGSYVAGGEIRKLEDKIKLTSKIREARSS